MMFFFRHLIGFFLFLFLTIYTAMKAPMVLNFNSLQHLPEMIRAELVKCLPSLPNIADLHKIKNELNTSLHSFNFSSLSGWSVMELLTNCLPDQFSLVSSLSSIYGIFSLAQLFIAIVFILLI